MISNPKIDVVATSLVIYSALVNIMFIIKVKILVLIKLVIKTVELGMVLLNSARSPISFKPHTTQTYTTLVYGVMDVNRCMLVLVNQEFHLDAVSSELFP